LTLPSTPPGFFTESDEVWIGMILDFGDAVAEGAEDNNSNLGEDKDFDRVFIDGRPDLCGGQFAVDVNILNFGQADVSFTVRNIGAAASEACNVGFYLSENSTFSLLDDLLGQQDIPALNAGHLYSATINLTVPTADPFGGDGTYYVGMITDRFDAVNEADEGNNSSRGLGWDYDAGNYGRKIFFTDFDHGDGGMAIDNEPGGAAVPGLWHRTSHRSSSGGTYSMYFGQEGVWDYDVGDTAGVFLTKTIELPDEPVAFSMKYWAQTDYTTSRDVFKVEVYDVVDDTYHTLLTKTDGSLSNTRGMWDTATADLTDYADRRVRLRFSFDTRDDQENAFEGVYFDEITVLAANNPITIEAFRNLKYDSNLYYDSLMHWAGDHDTLVFNEEQLGGMFRIQTYDHGSGVNGAVALYDYQTGEMLAIDDNSSGLGENGRIVFVNPGVWNSYIVELWDTEEDSMGNLDVLINGDDTILPSDVPLDPNGDGSLTNLYIDVDTDTDFYRATAPATANGMLDISIQVKDGALIPRLQVWKNDGDDAPEAVTISGSAHITGVGPGDVFNISISDNDFDGTGHFDLLVSFSTALPSEMTTAEGFAYFHWDGVSRDTQTFSTFPDDANITQHTDVDSFYFAGDVGWSGEYTIRVNALGGTVDPVLAVYGADTGVLLGFDDDSGGGTSAELTLPLTSFVRYIVAVADDDSFGTGDVEIIITAPQGTFGTSIPLDVHGDGQVSDDITTRDTDFYRFYSPHDTDGDLEVIVDPAGTLDAAVALFDAAGNLIRVSYLESTGANETISVSGLSPSTGYYLTVLAKDYATTGAYDLYVDFGVDSTPVNANAWYSTAEHLQGVGKAMLEVPDDGTFCEPRTAGVARLEIEFSEAIDPASFRPESVRMAGNDSDSNPVALSDITVSTSTAEGDTVGIIGFTPALPDAGRYIVQIEGVTDVAGNPLVRGGSRIFTALAGDAMSDLRVNAIDLSYIWPRRTIRIDGVSEDQTRSDVNCDGRVNAIDLSAAWPRRGGDMRSVRDPVLPGKLAGPSSDALAAAAILANASGESAAPTGAADATGIL
ncbi:MAG: CARDB domain-containing protein, partial [Phycisphaerae bacterium]